MVACCDDERLTDCRNSLGRPGLARRTSARPATSRWIAETAERPGRLVTRVRRGRVVITAVYPSINTISFVGPNNLLRTDFGCTHEVMNVFCRL